MSELLSERELRELCPHGELWSQCPACQKDFAYLKFDSIRMLEMKRKLLDQVIREGRAAGDPRIREPIRQQRIVNIALVQKISERRREMGQPEPPDQTIGLRSISISGRLVR